MISNMHEQPGSGELARETLRLARATRAAAVVSFLVALATFYLGVQTHVQIEESRRQGEQFEAALERLKLIATAAQGSEAHFRDAVKAFELILVEPFQVVEMNCGAESVRGVRKYKIEQIEACRFLKFSVDNPGRVLRAIEASVVLSFASGQGAAWECRGQGPKEIPQGAEASYTVDLRSCFEKVDREQRGAFSVVPRLVGRSPSINP
jgi:hypothetical protein